MRCVAQCGAWQGMEAQCGAGGGWMVVTGQGGVVTGPLICCTLSARCADVCFFPSPILPCCPFFLFRSFPSSCVLFSSLHWAPQCGAGGGVEWLGWGTRRGERGHNAVRARGAARAHSPVMAGNNMRSGGLPVRHNAQKPFSLRSPRLSCLSPRLAGHSVVSRGPRHTRICHPSTVGRRTVFEFSLQECVVGRIAISIGSCIMSATQRCCLTKD